MKRSYIQNLRNPQRVLYIAVSIFIIVGVILGGVILLSSLGTGNGASSSTGTNSSPPAPSQSSVTSLTSVTSITSTSSYTSMSTPFTATSSSFSSSTIAQSQGPLQITVSKTIFDGPEATPGYSAYIFDVSIENIGSGSYSINEFGFNVITNSNNVYSLYILNAIRLPLSTLTLSTSEGTSGQISFLIPSDQTPSKLEYDVPDEIGVSVIVPNIPQPSVWVSKVSSVVVTLAGPNSNQIDSYGGIKNSSSTFYGCNYQCNYYYTGDIIYIQLESAYNNYPPIVNVSVTAITVAKSDYELPLASISPSLPLPVTASGGYGVLCNVYLRAPSSTFSGDIYLNVTTS
jgi:hypothetical protein